MWHILNYIPPRGKHRSRLESLIKARNPKLELFAPTFVELSPEKGIVKQKEKPLLFHYIFIKGDDEDVKALCMEAEGFSFVLDRATRRHLTIPDEQLEQFRTIARYYAGQLPCYPLEGINLEEGDKVEVVTGPFAGLTGTFMSRKGGKKGNILVAIDSGTAAVVYDIKADFVKVLEFSKNSKRLYDQLDAFAEKLTLMLEKRRETLDVNDLAAANSFTTRLGELHVKQPKTDARLQAMLYAAYRLLSDKSKSEAALAKFKIQEKNITNANTRTFCEQIIRQAGRI